MKKLILILTIAGLAKTFACSPLPGTVEETVTPINATSNQWTQVLHPYSGAPADTMIDRVVTLPDYQSHLQDLYRDNKNIFIATVTRIGYDGAYADTVFYSVNQVYRNWWGVHPENEMSFVTDAHLGADCFLSNETLVGQSFLAFFDEDPSEVGWQIFPQSTYRPMGNYHISEDEQGISHYWYPGFTVAVEDLDDLYSEEALPAKDAFTTSDQNNFNFTGESLNINWSDAGSYNVSVFNTSGRLVSRSNMQGTGSLNFTDLNQGVYFVRLQSEVKTVTGKFILGPQ